MVAFLTLSIKRIKRFSKRAVKSAIVLISICGSAVKIHLTSIKFCCNFIFSRSVRTVNLKILNFFHSNISPNIFQFLHGLLRFKKIVCQLHRASVETVAGAPSDFTVKTNENDFNKTGYQFQISTGAENKKGDV